MTSFGRAAAGFLLWASLGSYPRVYISENLHDENLLSRHRWAMLLGLWSLLIPGGAAVSGVVFPT